MVSPRSYEVNHLLYFLSSPASKGTVTSFHPPIIVRSPTAPPWGHDTKCAPRLCLYHSQCPFAVGVWNFLHFKIKLTSFILDYCALQLRKAACHCNAT